MNREMMIKEMFSEYGFMDYYNRKISGFVDLLIEENQKYNLASIKDEKEYLEKNLIDSLMIYRLEKKLSGSLIDIGSGNGFPGVILALTSPELSVTLVDSNNKKISFLEKVKEKLCPELVLKYTRAEKVIEENSPRYDYVSAKALVSDPKRWLRWTTPLLRKGGISVNYKTEQFLKEISYAGIRKELKKDRISLYKKLEYKV
ncbi:MAG: 16S rRNA (guanine(527)-N(7))-methyltransferase RsmG, partial [Candidatus Muiribacteriaceae bacterium]